MLLLRTILCVLLIAGLFSAMGCGEDKPSGDVPRPRIVSFAPSTTTMLYEMGLGDHIVGVTKYCDVPDSDKTPPKVVGDLQNINVELILSVQPDILLISQESTDFTTLKQHMAELQIEHFENETLDHIAVSLERLGKLTGNPEKGLAARKQFEEKLASVRKRVATLGRTRAFFLIGANPPQVAGRNSFLFEMTDIAGADDLSGQYPRWTQISIERLLKDKPDVIICHALPGAEEEARMVLSKLTDVPAIKNNRLFIVTDRHWTIPSSHLAELTEKLAEMLHPELVKESKP